MEIETIRDTFREEARDLLSQMEMPLMELENSPDNPELINTVFRALHTIKGSGSMCGYSDLARFTHDLETVFDCMRNGELRADSRIIGLTLKAKDCIRTLLDDQDTEDEREKRECLLRELESITKNSSLAAVLIHNEHADKMNAESEVQDDHFRIIFMPSPLILSKGIRIEPLLVQLKTLGECRIRADVSSIPPIDELVPEICYMNWIAELITDSGILSIKDIFIFAEDYAEIIIKYNEGFQLNNEVFSRDELAAAIMRRFERSSVNVERRGRPGDENVVLDRRKSDTSTIRVKNEKLDTLVNLVGELVTLQARLNQESANSALPEFMSISESFGRLTNELRENTMSIRMVPIGEMFNTFHRLVHDLSAGLGKKMKLVTSGGQTELDKNVIEELKDPLMHLVRNSADHGIEDVDSRLVYGKEPEGSISINAEHAGSNVVIRVSDDGAGLNREKIKEKAIAKNLLAPGDYDDRQIFSMIFEPGFSTAAVTTDISGRGVGMDVVKRNIEKLRGTIDISSIDGQGTEVTLTIPLTLSIIDGFMVDIGGSLFIFNLSNVRECLDFNSASDSETENQFVINLRDEIVPCIDLRRIFGINRMWSAYPQIVIAEIAGERFGFLVDRVIGKYQTVVKPLARGSRSSDMIAGATILGDGSVALILDANAIVRYMSAPANGQLQ
ncbi:MAG TPA: chemotaxis protein CheA [Spirochaetota bacterium]|nr:chemotaxis protein CheA [Spirochaetota bacterium]